MPTPLLLTWACLAIQGQRQFEPPSAVRYLTPQFAVATTRNVEYALADNLSGTVSLKLDIYEPAGDIDPARAVVIWIHGGGFTKGDKSEMQPLCEYAAARGYVALSPNYRLIQAGQTTTEGLEYGASDAMAAVRWARLNAALLHLDTTRIAVAGSSAGAASALGAAYDPLRFEAHNLSNPGISSEVHAVIDLSGWLEDVAVIDSGELPVCVIHSYQDLTIAFQNAADIVTRCDSVGVVHYDHFLTGGCHGLSCDPAAINAWSRDFLFQTMIR